MKLFLDFPAASVQVRKVERRCEPISRQCPPIKRDIRIKRAVKSLIKLSPIGVNAGDIGKNSRTESKRFETPDRFAAGQRSGGTKNSIRLGKLFLDDQCATLPKPQCDKMPCCIGMVGLERHRLSSVMLSDPVRQFRSYCDKKAVFGAIEAIFRSTLMPLHVPSLPRTPCQENAWYRDDPVPGQGCCCKSLRHPYFWRGKIA